MTKDEFTKVFCEIINLYGEKNYPSFRQELIFDVVKNLDQNTFLEIVKKIIGNERNAPLLDNFKQYAKPFLAEYNDKFTSEVNSKNACSKCNSSGIVVIKKPYLNFTTDYAYKCDCLIGQKLYPSFPIFPKAAR